MYTGSIIDTLAPILSANDCQKLCMDNPNCQFWTWHSVDKCWLQSENARHSKSQCEAAFTCTRGPRVCEGKQTMALPSKLIL